MSSSIVELQGIRIASFNCRSGQLHSGSHINFGPVNHLDLLLNSDRGIPRVPSSAGLGVLGNVSTDSLECFSKFLQFCDSQKFVVV